MLVFIVSTLATSCTGGTRASGSSAPLARAREQAAGCTCCARSERPRCSAKVVRISAAIGPFRTLGRSVRGRLLVLSHLPLGRKVLALGIAQCADPYEEQHASARVYHADQRRSGGRAAYCACVAAGPEAANRRADGDCGQRSGSQASC